MRDLVSIVDELHALKHERQELDDRIESLQDEIKRRMTAENTELMYAGEWEIHWTTYERATIDTKRLKHDLPNIAELYTTKQTLRRFSIN